MKGANFILGFVFISFSCFCQTYKTPEVSIEVPLVLKAIDQYTDYIKVQKPRKKSKLQIILRTDKLNNNEVVYYIWYTRFLSYFKNDLPHSFFKYRNKTVFVYKTRSEISFEVDRFKTFYNQFQSVLEKDISNDGSKLNDNVYMPHEIFEGWKVSIDKNHDLVIKKLSYDYPTSKFFREYDYDSEGYLIYKDGIYHNSVAEANSAQPPKDFDVRKFLLENAAVHKDSLSRGTQRDVEALVVIDENGKILEVKVRGITDLATKMQIEGDLMKMPLWRPAILNGKRIKVRTPIRL